jgi:polyphosphate glucokinase
MEELMEQENVSQALGVDIGGSGIKGALVDVRTGEFVAERFRLPTPPQALPSDVAQVVADIVGHFGWQGATGSTFPAIIKHGVAHTAANIDPSWIGIDVQALLAQQAGVPFVVLNDADAAGIAEMRLGAGKDQPGVVIVLTLGTGIGSALFVDGVLVPNTELGHLEIQGKVAEHRSSDRVRKEKDLEWDEWAERLNDYLAHVERLFSPDLFILSGGVSKKHAKYLHLLETQARIVPAHLLNNAGIVGAAMAAKEQHR